VIKDVRVRESTIAINSAMSRILPFPCMFQIVTDKIAAFDQAMLQPYQVIILPLRSTETFSNSSFLEYMKSVDLQGAPEVIYLTEVDDDGDDDDSKRLLRLSVDSSIPVHELAQLLASIVHAPSAHFPAAHASSDSGDMEDTGYTTDIHSAIPVIPVARVPSRSTNGRAHSAKRKITFAEAAPVPSEAPAPRVRAAAQPAYDPAIAAVYHQHWLAAHAHHHWFAQHGLAHGSENHQGGAADMCATAHHRAVSAEEPSDRLSCESTDFALAGSLSGDGGDCGMYYNTSTSSSSGAELEITADDDEAFNCCLDDFDEHDELFAQGSGARD
jgi:hypothetical protein